jgi:hypothetical protein
MTTTIRAAVAAAVLIVPVAVESLLSADDDPTWAHLVFAASQALGWLLLLTVAGGLGDRVGGSRWGQRLVVAGCVLQLAFAVGYGALTAVRGEPGDGVFVLFLAGFLALTAGGLTWGLRIRRQAPAAGWGLVAVAGLGFLAMAVGVDPFHDLLLLSSYAAWVLVARGSDAGGTPSGVSAGSRSVSTRH